jgi:hypothetical protein
MEKPRKEAILTDMRIVLDAQRRAQEATFEAKKKRVVLEHVLNAKRSHYLVRVTNMRDEEGRFQYPNEKSRDAAVGEFLTNDEDYQATVSLVQKIDEDIFTAKLDLAYFDGEWTILKTEAALMAIDGCQCK